MTYVSLKRDVYIYIYIQGSQKEYDYSSDTDYNYNCVHALLLRCEIERERGGSKITTQDQLQAD